MLTTFLTNASRQNERMIPIVFALVPTIVGAAILIGLNGSDKKGVLLFAVYLVGTFGSALSIIYAWNASNTSGHTKKVTINAMTLVAFGLGNVAGVSRIWFKTGCIGLSLLIILNKGTEIFQPKDAPSYVPGKIAILVLLTTQIFVCFLLRWINLRLNRKKREILEAAIARH